MKKLAKTLFMSLVALAATSAIADTPPKMVSFSTKPGLTYGDGSKVLENEFVALCWSPNDEFEGIKIVNGEFKAVGANDDVICAMQLVDANSQVPSRVFIVKDRGAGTFFVFILDTRVSANALAKVVNGVPVSMNGAASAVELAATDEVLNGDSVVGSTDYNASKYVTSEASLEISTVDGYPTVRAVGLSPILKYKIVYGDEIGKLETANGTFSLYGNQDAATITITDGSQAKFFQLLQAE